MTSLDTAADRTRHKLIHQKLAAIETPFQLQLQQHESSSASHDPRNQYAKIMDRLGGQDRLSNLLNAKDPNRPIELELIQSNSNHFIRPIVGEFVNTSNILVKIIKRTRKPRNATSSDQTSASLQNPDPQSIQPTRRLYKIEPLGLIPLTVRFRALADYHYTPDLQHPISILARDMRSLNAEGVLKFRFENETEDYSSSSKIALFPPPLFSRYLVHQLYNYRQSVPSVVANTKEGYQRLVNRSKYVPLAPQSITYDQPQVPQGPLQSVLTNRKAADEPMYQQIEALFEQRPMWMRVAFQNQFTQFQLRLLRRNREIIALSCYTFKDGPFKGLLARFKYDPRVNPEARFFQRVSLRNLEKTDASEKFTFKLMRKTVHKAAGSGELDSANQSGRRDHIFDGLELHQSVGTYQLCDITEPLLKLLINSTKGVLPKCHPRTGWYTSNAIEQIRSILRKKFHALSEEQRVVKDIECVDLLDIDVSQDAVDLLKRPSATEKRFQADRDQSTQASTDDPRRKSPPINKPLRPNPLMKYRREKSRIKAKPANKSVTFADPSNLVEEIQMAEDNSDRTNENMGNAETSTAGTTGEASANEIAEGETGEAHGDAEDDDIDVQNSSDDEDWEEFYENENEEDGMENDEQDINQAEVTDRPSSDLTDLSESDDG